MSTRRTLIPAKIVGILLYQPDVSARFHPGARNRRLQQKETIYQNVTKVEVMQLPRGTFREIRKGETIDTILTELERTKFSGICSISSSAGTGTIVLKSGKCILVKFQGKSGDAGWDELQKSLSEEVDAALSSLDDAQIQLSLEFNKVSRLIKTGKPAPEVQKHAPQPHEPVKKPAPPVQPASPAATPRLIPKPAAPAPPAYRPAPPVQPKMVPEPQPQKAQTIFQRPAMPAPPAQHVPARQHDEARAVPVETIQDTGTTGSSFEKDIDTFDTMDLDNVTDKIRNDCKTMIKQLHLEHLMER
jgi:hypothetical protein